MYPRWKFKEDWFWRGTKKKKTRNSFHWKSTLYSPNKPRYPYDPQGKTKSIKVTRKGCKGHKFWDLTQNHVPLQFIYIKTEWARSDTVGYPPYRKWGKADIFENGTPFFNHPSPFSFWFFMFELYTKVLDFDQFYTFFCMFNPEKSKMSEMEFSIWYFLDQIQINFLATWQF